MLNYGKIVISRLSHYNRHVHTINLYRLTKHSGTIQLSSSNYSNNLNQRDVHTGLSSLSTKKIPAPCEAKENGTCPSPCYDGSSQGPSDKSQYWKQILAAFIVTGVTFYVMYANNFLPLNNSKDEEETKTKKVGIKQRKRQKIKSPLTSDLMPEEVPYLLIGGGTAAFSAFRSIKSRDPTAKVLVITEESDMPYMRPPLSKELWYNTDRSISTQLNFKQWNGAQRSLFYEPSEFYANVSDLMKSEKGGVAVATGWKITKIDAPNKTAYLEDGRQLKYNKCLLATGASPKELPLSNVDSKIKEKIITYRTKEDFLDLEESIHNPNVKNIAIIGGGFLGSELACSLARNCHDKQIFQIYREPYLMAQILPEYLCKWTAERAQSEGVHCVPNAEVKSLSLKDGRVSISLSNKETIDADQIVVAIGVEVKTDLAKESNLEIDSNNGGYLVNAELEARSNLWVAGDAACFYDVKLGRRRVEHHDHAVISGRLAGENMTGAGKPYTHQSMFWSDLGPEIGYEAIGIIDSSLPTYGAFVYTSEETTSVHKEKKAEEKSDENKDKVTSKTMTIKSKSVEKNKNEMSRPSDFRKGVVFYLRENVIVGILLWNVFNRMSIARQILTGNIQYDDLNEVAKLFMIHEE